MKTLKYLSLAFILSLAFVSCSEDYLETDDTSALAGQEQAGEAAGKEPAAFLNGIWSYLVTATATDAFGVASTFIVFDSMSEDMPFGEANWFLYDYQFDYRLEMWARTGLFWSTYYTAIAKANEIIELFPNGGSTAGEKGLIGQAYATRGWAYTNLVQIYQDYMNDDGTIKVDAPAVPLKYNDVDAVEYGLSAEDIKKAEGRNTVGKVLEQAGKDLEKAVALLAEGYERPVASSGKNFIDYSVAQGFAARYYSLVRDWDKAANAANEARKGYRQRTQSELFDGFMDVTAPDVMWGYDHSAESHSGYASYHSHMSNYSTGYAGGGHCPKLIDARLYSQIANDDYRKALFNDENKRSDAPTAGTSYAYANLKFGSTTASWKDMDYIYMRAAEMVLIEAEAYARLGDGAKAATVLKELMAYRQPSWNKTLVSVEDVLLQRRIELWGEGFAFYDLKRNNKGVDRTYEGNNHLTGYKLVIPAHDLRFTFQLPKTEIRDNDMIEEDEQNP